MRIAIWHNLPSGGGKRALFYQVKGLTERGHTVKVWTPPTSCQTFGDIRPFAEEVVVPLRLEPPKKSAIDRGRRAIREMRHRLDSMIDHCRVCARQMESEGFDLLYANPCMFFRATPIAEVSTLPAVLYQQEPFRELYEALPNLPWPAPNLAIPKFWPPRQFRSVVYDWNLIYAKRLQARAELEWSRKFRHIFVNSLFSRESVQRAYGLESRVVYLGIDGDVFQPAGGAKKAYVIGLGTVAEGKGTDRAIDAVATIPEEMRPPLVWVGNLSSAPYEAAMRQRAEEKGVKLTIHVMATDAQLVKLLSEAACMIYTSRLEPFGFAPLEANACGTGAVAIAEGGVRETMVHGVTGFITPGFEPGEMAEHITYFTSNLDRAEKFGRQARKHVLETWSWKRSNDRLEKLLLNAASQATKEPAVAPEPIGV